MDDLGRVVVVTAGFALWKEGKCVAAARWSDLARLRAYRGVRGDPAAVCLGVDLIDGTVLELRDAAPGFDVFLARAGTVLSSLPAPAEWGEALRHATNPAVGLVLFERAARTKK